MQLMLNRLGWRKQIYYEKPNGEFLHEKPHGRIWSEFKFVTYSMSDLVTCKFAEDLIKNEGAVVSTFSIINLWECVSVVKCEYI